MRKADRLFQIVQILRRNGRPVTADAIAEELETSKRSIYRDIAALMGQRVPIRGEAGVGYVLEGGFDLPPLMLTADEIDAVALGAHWVAEHGDPGLARAALDVLAKVAAVLPEDLRPFLMDSPTRAVRSWNMAPDGLDVVQLRSWIRKGRKIAIAYSDEADRPSERTIWPLLVGYRDATRLLVAWCELRTDFRTFRLDRIRHAEFMDEAIPKRPALLRAQYLKTLKACD
ncbi:helix-turn-helix transcriptional regulator [Sphingobium nicotianae]|uniref:YafY family transcriptional regulator n=1 Tax=Sphingobium nicotianae TaxID=2782607 RepID=A0A9X1DC89_9SPHN|nr:YafY family protein [Sphingobium nicotianae]MBT2187472.1 YafY family transcriptional regulator [Sphingobium nicotianae]